MADKHIDTIEHDDPDLHNPEHNWDSKWRNDSFERGKQIIKDIHTVPDFPEFVKEHEMWKAWKIGRDVPRRKD